VLSFYYFCIHGLIQVVVKFFFDSFCFPYIINLAYSEPKHLNCLFVVSGIGDNIVLLVTSENSLNRFSGDLFCMFTHNRGHFVLPFLKYDFATSFFVNVLKVVLIS
jgi:hypothetical protein